MSSTTIPENPSRRESPSSTSMFALPSRPQLLLSGHYAGAAIFGGEHREATLARWHSSKASRRSSDSVECGRLLLIWSVLNNSFAAARSFGLSGYVQHGGV